MEYSTSLFIEALVRSSNWFILYLIVYGLVGLFIAGSVLAVLSGFGSILQEKDLTLIMFATAFLILSYPSPNSILFYWVDVNVKGKYVEPIKSYVHKDSLEKLKISEISEIIKYKYDDKDDFYLKFRETLLTNIPKNVEFNTYDLNEELYPEYKKCFANKDKPHELKSMGIKEIRKEVHDDKITCARHSAVLLKDPKRIEQFIKKM